MLYHHYVLNKSFDVFHSVDSYIGPLSVIIATKITRTPAMVTMRGLPIVVTEQYHRQAIVNNRYHSLIFHRFMCWFYSILPRFVDFFIFKSPSEYEFFRDVSGTPFDYEIIPTGVDLTDFNPNSGDGEHAETLLDVELFRTIASAPYVLLCAGRIVKRKAVDNLVRIHQEAELDDVLLLIVGDGDKDYLGKVKSLAEGDPAIYIYDERLPHDSMPALINEVDGVLQLSTYGREGSPQLLQESLAMNTPCIASNLPGIREAFNDIGGCILINPEDSLEYEDAVKRVVQGHVHIDTHKVRDRFNFEANYTKVANCYKELIGINKR